MNGPHAHCVRHSRIPLRGTSLRLSCGLVFAAPGEAVGALRAAGRPQRATLFPSTNRLAAMTLPPEIFKAYDIRGVVGRTLTPAIVRAVGLDELEAGGAEHLGQPPLRRSSPQVDLKQSILGLHESLRHEEVGGVARVDVRNAPAVADDAHLVAEAVYAERAGSL